MRHSASRGDSTIARLAVPVPRLSRRRRAAAAALCLAAFLPTPAGALNLEEWVQGLTLTPFLSEKVEYESNVFQTPNKARGDTVFKTIPGFLAELSRGPLSASLGYRAEILNYVTLTAQDTTNQFIVAQVKLEMPRLTLQLRDDFTETISPPGSELTGPVKSETNVLAPTAEYRLTERFSVGANYAWTHANYPSTSAAASSPNAQQNQAVQQLNSDLQIGGATLWWKFLPKSDVGLSLQYGAQTFDNDSNRDYRLGIVALALRGSLTSKLSSTFRIGIEHWESVNGTVPDYTGLIMGGAWTFQLTERTQITLNTDRSPQLSVFESAQYYITSTAWLGVRHEFPSRKVALWLRTGAGEDAYTTKQFTANGVTTKYRKDTIVGAATGLDYTIQPWLRTGIEYSFRQRTSNFPQFNYDDSRFSGRITLQF